MKAKLVLILLVLCMGISAQAQAPFDVSAKAKETIYLFRQAKFETVYNRMDKDMKRVLDVEKLQGFWDVLEMRMGAVKEVGEPKITDRDSLFISVTPIQFEKQKIALKLVFNKQALISGMYLEAANPQHIPAAYIDASRFYENKKTLADPTYPVEGMLTLPNRGKPFPVVIIVAGSGPTDKDLTMGPNRVYKDIAWGLASKGVAAFRYDKRTKTYGAEIAKNKNATVKEEYLLDLQLAVQMLKKNPDIDSTRIYILGHSEGGYLMPYFEKNIKGIAGYIGFAAAYSEMAPMIYDQLVYLQSMAPKKDQASFEPIKHQAIYAQTKLNENSPTDSLPLGISAAYLMYLNQNSPQKLSLNLNQKKVLFIQGGRDYQVPPSELEKWKQALKANTQADFEVYPVLNHLGLEGKGKSKPEEYESPGNVPEEVINRMVRFVLY
ncbi:MAG: hypothetical protein CFE21_01470 [Bacteroidetes bacterium B1(2017)]|nr:MAG: hypothetical protein CFE21_01470 [Bacteroidetes bacterium B1(2017)]